MNLYLQFIVESIQLENLPQEWIEIDWARFSDKKKLFDYQQQALKNAVKALYKYYNHLQVNKEKFFSLYQNNGFTENLDYKLNGNKKLKIFEEFDKDYKIENNKIKFYHFINRMSFWMATGSGKTIVIVKLIELLAHLIKNQSIPNNDILFLTCREDLIEQFKNHIEEFNRGYNNFHIHLYNLKDYEKIKKLNRLKFEKEIEVFYYRSDLISDNQKDKIVDFRNFDNEGKWYILLDEAHKGDKEDSKRQIYYSILSRNGFLFNFSATFTDPIDFATCVFNFNLEKFIQQGFGKHIYISRTDIQELGKKNDFDEKQKQIIILKILLLHSLIRKNKPENYYHNPLILTLVNSVNTEDSDLFLFFKEIEKIASGQTEQTDKDLLSSAKNVLKSELKGIFEFENERLNFDDSIIDSLNFNDILENIFNTKTTGNIEVLKVPGNKQEIILKLKTSEKPFALIKIGDISEWIKNKLSEYQIIEKFENESVFRNLNKDDSDINILMGSRSFYEGWDSNRPNIILYINIGKGTDAKKFVLQSIGRGIRIEPLPNKRKRLQYLYNNGEINEILFNELKDKIKSLETLFVYGTKPENLQEVIETLKQETQEELLGDLFEINPDVKDKLLIIPIYKESDKILADESFTIKFEINPSDLELTKNYFNHIGEKIALMKYDCPPKVLNKVKESFSKIDDYYLTKNDALTLNKPDLLLNQIFKHFSLKTKEFHQFKKLENEIVHFKHIRISKEKLNELKEKIEKVKKFPEKGKVENILKNKLENQEIDIDTFLNLIRQIDKEYPQEIKESSLKIKYIQNHYYIPVFLSENERIDYIKHIIKTKSEVNFIYQLENYLANKDNVFNQMDWWLFSKLDETLDEVYIPYYQPKTNKIEKFKPDFIFWLKKDNNYTILFVDPKGTEHTDAYRKIDGYSRIFETNGNGKKYVIDFHFKDLIINVKLLLISEESIARTLEKYRKYWFINFDDFAINKN